MGDARRPLLAGKHRQFLRRTGAEPTWAWSFAIAEAWFSGEIVIRLGTAAR